MRRASVIRTPLVSVVLLFASCGQAEQPAEAVTEAVIEPPRGWPFGTVPVRDEFNTTMQRFEGSFLIVDGCMFLSGGGSGPGGRYLAAFPYPGVGWDADTETLYSETVGLRVYVGEGFSLLGDVIPFDPDHPFWLTPPPGHCAAENVFLGLPSEN